MATESNPSSRQFQIPTGHLTIREVIAVDADYGSDEPDPEPECTDEGNTTIELTENISVDISISKDSREDEGEGDDDAASVSGDGPRSNYPNCVMETIRPEPTDLSSPRSTAWQGPSSSQKPGWSSQFRSGNLVRGYPVDPYDVPSLNDLMFTKHHSSEEESNGRIMPCVSHFCQICLSADCSFSTVPAPSDIPGNDNTSTAGTSMPSWSGGKWLGKLFGRTDGESRTAKLRARFRKLTGTGRSQNGKSGKATHETEAYNDEPVTAGDTAASPSRALIGWRKNQSTTTEKPAGKASKPTTGCFTGFPTPFSRKSTAPATAGPSQAFSNFRSRASAITRRLKQRSNAQTDDGADGTVGETKKPSRFAWASYKPNFSIFSKRDPEQQTGFKHEDLEDNTAADKTPGKLTVLGSLWDAYRSVKSAFKHNKYDEFRELEEILYAEDSIDINTRLSRAKQWEERLDFTEKDVKALTKNLKSNGNRSYYPRFFGKAPPLDLATAYAAAMEEKTNRCADSRYEGKSVLDIQEEVLIEWKARQGEDQSRQSTEPLYRYA